MTTDFDKAVSEWKTKALVAAEAANAYRVAHGRAYVESALKTDALKKGEADAKTDELRQRRDLAEIEAQSAKWRVEYLLRLAGKEAA